MKKSIVFFTALLFVVQAFSQTPETPLHYKSYYLEKSKNQKTLGWVMLGGGLGLVAIGSATYKTQPFTFSFSGTAPAEHYNNTVPSILIVTGFAAMIGSIPVFIVAHGNRKKAAAVSINNQDILLPQQHTVKTQPTISIRFAI